MNAQTNIQRRLAKRIEESPLTPKQVAEGVSASELYGRFSYTSLRMLLTHDFEGRVKPRSTFNGQLLIALSEVLDCHVSDLATERDLSAIRDVPYRRNQWPKAMLDEHYLSRQNVRTTVTAPKTTAARIVAYSKQHAYNNATQLAERLREFGYRISNRDMRYVWETEPDPDKLRRLITWQLCVAVTKVFRGRMGANPFDVQWLLTCTDACPHCRPDLYIYG